MKYCEITYNPWKFNFVYFVGREIHKFKIPKTIIYLNK